MIYKRMDGIRYRRELAGLNVPAAAEALCVTKQVWYMWERGEYMPSSGLLPDMAKVLRCRIEDLYEAADEQ